MSTLSPEPLSRDGRSPYRLEAGEGPQTIGELHAQLTVVSPADREQFEADLAAARPDEAPGVITAYRHVWALRTRPEVASAIAAELAGTVPMVPVDLAQDA
jgi:hypothetical protein